ncbi:hypothetical protein [uncultured Kordia sp.]|uniref:hypothetical protein n=1 Tax=uncultured Kordia sp. TaxID=507699 RepID=UPI002637194B|nr:hypothetical protein [uncultured Kordia sp.]
MPNTAETSEQYQSLTTSSEGRNVMPLLQPKSHFFLEDSSFSQSEPQRFGAVSLNQFNTTSTLTFSGTKKVYALCQGTVFIQPQTGDANKVNLILRPFRQPISNIPIKYIIYRGLNKSDFVNSNGEIAGSETTGTGFVQYIWSEFLQFYGTDGVNDNAPDFMADFIGYPHTTDQLAAQDGANLIDQYFFKIATVLDETTGEEEPSEAFEFPTIPRGTHLGNATGEIGIDIVLNRGDYYIENDPNPFKLDLAYARAANSSLDASTITDSFQKRLYKENATAFLDVAALYGLHANGAGKLYVGDSTTPLTTKDDIYGMMNGFYSRNKVYIYIQANRQRSYNFYGNYEVSDTNTNNMKIGVDSSTLSETTFGTFEWPIHETTTIVSDPAENTSFAFQLTTDNYADASMYVQLGRVASEHEENFIRDKNLLEQDPEADQTFTQSIVMNVNATTTDVICSYVNVLCESREMIVEGYVPASNPTAHPKDMVIKDIDDVFGMLNAVIINTSASNVQLPTIIDERLQIINFPNTSASNDTGVIKYQKIEDRLLTDEENTYINRVTYETLVSDIKRDASPYKSNNSSHIDSTKSSTQTYADNENRFYQPRLPYKLEKKLFTDNETTVTGVSLTVDDGSTPTKKIIGLLDTELGSLKSLMQTNSISNTRLYFIKQSISDKESFTSIENVKYYKYHVGVVGEDATGALKLFEPQDAVILYSLDQFVFASTKYSEFIPELRQKNYTNIEIPEE